MQPGRVGVLAVGDLVAAVGVGERGEHLGVQAGVVVGREAAALGVVQGRHGSPHSVVRALSAQSGAMGGAYSSTRAPLRAEESPSSSPVSHSAILVGLVAVRPVPIHLTTPTTAAEPGVAPVGPEGVREGAEPRLGRCLGAGVCRVAGRGCLRGGRAHDRHAASPGGEQVVVQREGRVPQRVDEVAREPAPVVVGRVGETVTAAPATDEVEERVDVPVVRHDVAGQGLDGVAVEQVADPRVETTRRAATELAVDLAPSSARSDSSEAASRPTATTCSPRASRAAQVARPVAPVAPVTTTTRIGRRRRAGRAGRSRASRSRSRARPGDARPSTR